MSTVGDAAAALASRGVDAAAALGSRGVDAPPSEAEFLDVIGSCATPAGESALDGTSLLLAVSICTPSLGDTTGLSLFSPEAPTPPALPLPPPVRDDEDLSLVDASAPPLLSCPGDSAIVGDVAEVSGRTPPPRPLASAVAAAATASLPTPAAAERDDAEEAGGPGSPLPSTCPPSGNPPLVSDDAAAFSTVCTAARGSPPSSRASVLLPLTAGVS
jgi:hypothetical protein